MPLKVAILGRPNVGKSTLFNRLVGRRTALVHPSPGVTRDRREGAARLLGLAFDIVDTAGLEEAEAESLSGRMQRQTDRAVEQADLVLLLIDARAGITPLDRQFANRLRRTSKPVVLVANKCEGSAGAGGLIEAFELGFDEPVAVSAEHGEGLVDLRDAIERRALALGVSQASASETEDDTLRLAIVGRPNVGKSTLFNRLLDEERVITGPEPGLTRDAIWVSWRWRDRDISLIDTAGLRRPARVRQKLERITVADTEHAVRFAHVVVLLIDALEGMDKQDLTIARHIIEEGRAMVLALNKWDAVPDRAAVMRDIGDRLDRSLPQVRGIPVVALSALTRAGVNRLLPAVVEVHDVWNRRVDTAPLNRWLQDVIERHPPPMVQGRRPKLRYITQVKARPPTFSLFTSRPGAVPDSYLRYLTNGLREDFGLSGIPIRIVLRKRRNPYVEDSRA